MKPLDILIRKVRDLDTISFLKDNINEREVENACVMYLKSLNYKVVKPPKLFKIKDVDHLINRFYHLLDYYGGDTLSVNRDKDKAILTRFIKLRQEELDISYDAALQDTALLMQGLFMYEKDLGLTVPLGIWVFGSIKYRWVIDKIAFILNSEKDLYNDIAVGRLVELDELKDDSYTGFDFEHLRRIHG